MLSYHNLIISDKSCVLTVSEFRFFVFVLKSVKKFKRTRF